MLVPFYNRRSFVMYRGWEMEPRWNTFVFYCCPHWKPWSPACPLWWCSLQKCAARHRSAGHGFLLLLESIHHPSILRKMGTCLQVSSLQNLNAWPLVVQSVAFSKRTGINLIPLWDLVLISKISTSSRFLTLLGTSSQCFVRWLSLQTSE